MWFLIAAWCLTNYSKIYKMTVVCHPKILVSNKKHSPSTISSAFRLWCSAQRLWYFNIHEPEREHASFPKQTHRFIQDKSCECDVSVTTVWPHACGIDPDIHIPFAQWDCTCAFCHTVAFLWLELLFHSSFIYASFTTPHSSQYHFDCQTVYYFFTFTLQWR